jgi:steroid 5-alpha reductase family enzyme
MSLTEALTLSAFAVLAYVTAIWLLSLALRNVSIIDIFWGLGFVLLATLYHTTLDGFGGRNVLITSLVLVWGLRLSLHIFWRNRGKGEDYRYSRWREKAGASFWWTSFLRVFLLQGALLWVISIPLLAAIINEDPDHFTALDALGALLWGIGFTFEAGGDWQLMRFKVDPANQGKVMSRGLWRYTRHPNYFGDAALWWGFFLIAAGTTDGWMTIFSPLVMTILLVRVSGAALLERGLKKTKPGYQEYVEGTSGFVPWFPAKG